MIIQFVYFVLFIVTSEGHGDSKIQNGTEVDSTQSYPYVGSIQQPKKIAHRHRCMSNLVSTVWALTAAHCIILDECTRPIELIDFVAHKMFILMGTTNIRDGGPYAQQSNIVKGVVHSQFTSDGAVPFKQRFDLGAIRVETPFTLNDHVNLVPLFPRGTAVSLSLSRMTQNNGYCRIPGWGPDATFSYKKTELEYSPFLLHAQFDLLTDNDCCAMKGVKTICMEQIPNTGYSCTVPFGKNTSTTGGDSGAPVVCRWKVKNTDIVVGIHIGGTRITTYPEKYMVTRPGVFVKFNVMFKFILELTGGSNAPTHDEQSGAIWEVVVSTSLLFSSVLFSILFKVHPAYIVLY